MELIYVVAAVLILALPFALTRILSARRSRPGRPRGANHGAGAEAGTPRPDALRAHVARLLAQGGKLEAIKLLRERTGVGLAEAKQAVEAIAREEAIVPPAPGLAATIERARQMSEEVRRLAAKGQKTEAIKLLREKSGIGLKEAKDLVDRLG
jgi:ribosomal protein L7/L12